MRIETLDRFTPALDEIAGRSADATFYHTACWLQSVATSFPSLSLRFLVAGGKDPVAYLPFSVSESSVGRMLWSLPFGTYGGPITTGDETAASDLIDAFTGLTVETGVNEVGLVDFAARFDVTGFNAEETYTHMLDLRPGFDAVWAGFERSKRRQTRKAQRDGIVVTEASGAEEARQYYRIYVDRSEQWQQRIRYPESLFVRLLESRGGSVRLFLARLDDQLLGGHLNFYHGKSVIAWNGVTLPGSRGHQASTALYATCVEHACAHGYETYNLGGSLGKTSLESYKEALGGVAYPYRILRWRSLKGKFVAAVKKRLPGR